MLYLDHAASTPVSPRALEAAWPWLTSEYANPSSVHEPGLRAGAALEWARETCAKYLGCKPSELVFTSGGTESNNLAIQGIALANPRGKHLISAATEHSSVLRELEFLVHEHGFELTLLPVDAAGAVSPADLAAAIRPNTTLVTLMLANNEIGTVHPIAELAAIAANHAVPFHTDAVQAAGYFNLDVQALGVSALSLSGHKFGAPKGSGLLYIKGRTPLQPLIHGGKQELERRGGTPNVAWAVALATALSQLEEPKATSARISSVTNAFIDGVLAAHPMAKLTGPTPGNQRHPAIASFTFEGLNGETLLLELEAAGVVCSSGSACAAGSTDPSHVLGALGLQEELAQTAVRFSFGKDATADQATQALGALDKALSRLLP